MKWIKQYEEWADLYLERSRDCYECKVNESELDDIFLNEKDKPKYKGGYQGKIPEVVTKGLAGEEKLSKALSILDGCGSNLPCNKQFLCMYKAGVFPDWKTALTDKEQKAVLSNLRSTIASAACKKASRGLMPHCCYNADEAFKNALLWASVITIPMTGPAAAVVGTVSSLGSSFISFKEGDIKGGTLGLILAIIPFLKFTKILKPLFNTKLLRMSRAGDEVALTAEGAIKRTADALDKYNDLNDLSKSLSNGVELTADQKEFMKVLGTISMSKLAYEAAVDSTAVSDHWKPKILALKQKLQGKTLSKDPKARYEQLTQLA